MAPTSTNPKIEELRFKLKTDPKSRLFYPLAEELRKVGLFAEAEQVLRLGLGTHPTYLSAWVVLGRVLREQQKHPEAVTALTKALELDRGNVVAARLLADCYLAMGDKLEAVKKYKLVHALLPGDDDTVAAIHRIEQEIGGPVVAPPPPAPAPPAPPPAVPPPSAAAPTAPALAPLPIPSAAAAPPAAPAAVPPVVDGGDVFDVTYSKLKRAQEAAARTGDAEPMRAGHSQSPFEDQGADSGYSADAFAVERPAGSHLVTAPLGADTVEPFPAPQRARETSPIPEPAAEDGDVFGDSGIAPGFVQGVFGANVPPPPPADDFAKTITMADLYANQGLIDEARDIYEDVLARDPANEAVRLRLDALDRAAAGEAASQEMAPAREPAKGGVFAPADAEDPWPQEASPPPAAASSESAPGQPAPPGSSPAPSMAPDSTARDPKVDKLEGWLSRLKRPGAGRV